MKPPASKNIVASISQVSLAEREKRNRHRGCVLWFTGLSAAGKSTIANELEAALFARGCQTFVLDGDRVRHGLCSDLDFSEHSRHENIRRVGEVAKLFSDAGFICLAAFISPYQADRRLVREVVGEKFVEVYVNAPLTVCEARDPKGLYVKARTHKIKNFTGVSAPYEPPLNPEIEVRTDKLSVAGAVDKILGYVQKHFNVRRQASRAKPAKISWQDW
ncbi:MAG: adenylyl-sulfate kinase [Verrucomicrobiae bacterium]|nr:adenylyl-sulfate kinase [Verrucomicrobiae bacterium]